MRIPAPTLCALVLTACSAAPQPQPPSAARQVVEQQRWRVLDRTEPLGHVLSLQILDPAGAIPFFRILDAQGRVLGHATAQGRFSRRVPFQDEEQDLGVWSLERGTALLFERDAVQLEPVAAEASARRAR